MLPTENKSSILEVVDTQNNNICYRMLTNMFTIIISFRSSYDDSMQYLIIEELQRLMKRLRPTDHFILLTHNKHFYLNVKYVIINMLSVELLSIKVLIKENIVFNISLEDRTNKNKTAFYEATQSNIYQNLIRNNIMYAALWYNVINLNQKL